MKTPSDELFQLVKSLTTQEKVYFKIFATRKLNDNSVTVLFDLLNKMVVYDENQFKQSIRNKLILKNLKWFKHNTFQVILRSLEEYHFDASIDAQLDSMANQAKILFDKKLYTAAKKIVVKSERIAKDNEKYIHLLRLFLLKTGKAILEKNIGDLNEYSEKHIGETYIKYLKKYIDIQELVMRATRIDINRGITEPAILKKEVRKIMKSPILSSLPDPPTYFLMNNYYHIQSIGSLFCDDYKRAYQFLNEFVKYFESNKRNLEAYPNGYLATIVNLFISVPPDVSDYELKRLYVKARKFYLSIPLKNRSVDKICYLILNYAALLLSRNQPENALRLLLEIPKEIYFEKLPISVKLGFFYYKSLAYFLVNDLHSSLSSVNRVINCKSSDRQDIQISAKLLVLLIHYELGNYEILPNIANSAERFFKKIYTEWEVEKEILSFFKNIYKTNGKQKYLFSEIKNRVEKMIKSNQSSNPSLHQNLIYIYMKWLDSKIQNRPLIDIIKDGSH